jgi:excisionase family DNA binding protein
MGNKHTGDARSTRRGFNGHPVGAGVENMNSENGQSEWLTAAEAALYLRVKTRTLLLWARQGKVRGYKLSGIERHIWRFRHADLDATLGMPSVCPPERTEQ